MKNDFFSQLAIRLTSLEESIEETMYFSLAASLIVSAFDIKNLPLPSFLLGEVRQIVTSSLYFEYNESRKQKVLRHFPRYATSYSLIKLTASWEEFMLECIIVMEMAKTDDYSWKNETIIRKDLRNRGIGSKSGAELLKELDKLYKLQIMRKHSKEFQIISSIYKLRDCIAHRSGVISKWDLDKNTKFMTTVWKKVVVKKDKQIVSAWTLAGKSSFETVVRDEKKQWIENEVIVLKDTEICDIGLSFDEVGNLVFSKLVEYGKANNIK
ncbi:MAG: hypothetical protein ACOYZ8_05395 [Chloroflexota bacterium]